MQTATRDMWPCGLVRAALPLSLFSMFHVVVFVVFLPSHALPFSTEEEKREKEKLIKAEMKRAGGRPESWPAQSPVITKEKSQTDIETAYDFVDSNALHFGQPGFVDSRFTLSERKARDDVGSKSVYQTHTSIRVNCIAGEQIDSYR